MPRVLAILGDAQNPEYTYILQQVCEAVISERPALINRFVVTPSIHLKVTTPCRHFVAAHVKRFAHQRYVKSAWRVLRSVTKPYLLNHAGNLETVGTIFHAYVPRNKRKILIQIEKLSLKGHKIKIHVIPCAVHRAKEKERGCPTDSKIRFKQIRVKNNKRE